ncbi:hypothetical protein MTP99_006707 [Tenebrio molitor]|nr:hypothetical protein MTP99_006707 [Tenebrio molitor]
MVNGVVGGAVVEVDRRESESKGCDVFYPFGLAPPGVDTYVLWCVDRGRHSKLSKFCLSSVLLPVSLEAAISVNS